MAKSKTPAASEALAEWMQASKQTQESLAVYLNVTRQAVGRWLQGNPPSLEKAAELQKLTGIPAIAWMEKR